MNLFELIFTQPIFNFLLFLYSIIPGQDFGIAVIIFTAIVRLAMWPLVKKQLHQGKLMKQIQPQLVTIRKKAKGNKQLEATMMMELYREKGIKPFASIGLLLIQIPFFIALFQAITIVATHRQDIPRYMYEFMQSLPGLKEVAANPQTFNETLFGIVDLTKSAFNSSIGGLILFLALGIITGILQYIQSKQLMPQPKEKKRLRDMMKDQAAGKDVDQAEMMASVSGRMLLFLPFLMVISSISLAGALVLYLFTQTLIGFIQQYIILGKDVEELEDLAEKPVTSAAKKKPVTAAKKRSTAARAKRAKTAKVVGEKPIDKTE